MPRLGRKKFGFTPTDLLEQLLYKYGMDQVAQYVDQIVNPIGGLQRSFEEKYGGNSIGNIMPNVIKGRQGSGGYKRLRDQLEGS